MLMLPASETEFFFPNGVESLTLIGDADGALSKTDFEQTHLHLSSTELNSGTFLLSLHRGILYNAVGVCGLRWAIIDQLKASFGSLSAKRGFFVGRRGTVVMQMNRDHFAAWRDHPGDSP